MLDYHYYLYVTDPRVFPLIYGLRASLLGKNSVRTTVRTSNLVNKRYVCNRSEKCRLRSGWVESDGRILGPERIVKILLLVQDGGNGALLYQIQFLTVSI